MLQQFEQLPEGLLDLEATQLKGLLGGPSLFHLAGREGDSLFVSVLMHGNETTGWEAVRRWLRRYQVGGGNEQLPRPVSLFVGNVAAAAAGVRSLDGQPDFNRVWPGCQGEAGPEHQMMQQVVEIMSSRGLFASVDIHNNTGLNPHYACVNVIDRRYLHLAVMFSRTVVYFRRPCGVQSMAMAKLCPAVTLECGKPGQEYGVEHAHSYLDACLHLSDFPRHGVSPHDIDLFHTVATVKVPAEVSFSYSDPAAELQLAEDLELFNFRELPPGTMLARQHANGRIALDVWDEAGGNVAERFLELEQGVLRFRSPVMPSMLTRDEEVVRQDCLCYLMERYNDHLKEAG
jgi:succinylglutamate desuccinylase